ncbi:MAG: hypothetical protein CL931_04015 [Deltaproteobacteria bacterium]|nr:hypothetical protein [Deltaproteobacteria bacterium]
MNPSASLSRLLALLFFLWASPALAAPEVDLHDLTWFVHVDLIDAGVGRDLAFWTNVIEESVEGGNRLLAGRNGPVDNVCCTKMTHSVAVTTFGNAGDGLDVIDSMADQTALADDWSVPGSSAFLVDSLTYCNGSSPSAIGCARRPSCTSNGDDDPDLWMYVTVESYEDGTLPSVIAHERGHNACLQHVSTPKCALMQGTVFTPGLGGCLTTTECAHMRDARTETSSGEFCNCHDDAGSPLADGAKCDDAGGICSGGCCGPMTGDAGVHLLAAADPGDAGLAPEDMLRISGYTGDWTDLGPITGAADDVRALAYSTDGDLVYGIVPTVGDDRVITIDPDTGLQLATVGFIANGTDEFVSLAYDPGATSATTDDRLIGLEVTTGDTGELRWIDPASPNTAHLLGSLGWAQASAFSSLAFDPTLDKLLFATPFGPNGLWELDMGSCPPSCSPSQFPGTGPFWTGASMTWSAESGMAYVIGTSFAAPGTRTFYNVVDPATGATSETLSLDRFTPAGLASVPEPGPGLGLLVGAGLLGGLCRARGAQRRRSSPIR